MAGHVTDWFRLINRGVAKGVGGESWGDRSPPPYRHKNHSLKKAKSVEKLGGGGDTFHVRT